MSLWHQFLTHNDKGTMCKWSWYLPVYEKYLSSFVNKSFVLLEVGVNDGGSLNMWKKYFGPWAKIVGIDIEEKCRQYDDGEISVRIGSQDDPKFLQSIIEEFGTPYVVIDDGSHQWRHQIATFEFLYPKMSPMGVYIVEDTHTSYWREFGAKNLTPNFHDYSYQKVLEMGAKTANIDMDGINRGTRSGVQETEFSHTTTGIHFHDSMVVFEKGYTVYKKPISVGKKYE